MISKKLDAEYTYDYRLDLANMEVKQDYNCKKSIYLDVGVYLDLDENDVPVNLEIVDVAGKMGINKECFINPDGRVNITITKDVISVEVFFKFKKESECLQLNTINSLNIPNTEINLALV